MEPPHGRPEIFVIGGNGSGIAQYRRLARDGVPFGCRYSSGKCVDYEVAKALAAEVVCEKAFEPVSGETYQRALAVMKKCRQVLCCLPGIRNPEPEKQGASGGSKAAGNGNRVLIPAGSGIIILFLTVEEK